MNKRKLPDFLNNIHWNKKKCQKWLKTYPYLKSNLNQIQRLTKTTREILETNKNAFKRLYWLINICGLGKLYLYSTFKYASIANMYIQTTLNESLILTEISIVEMEINLDMTSKKLYEKDYIIAEGFEYDDFKQRFDLLTIKLNNISFYCEKFNLILKNLQRIFDTNFDTRFIIPQPTELKKIKAVSIANELHLNQIKNFYSFNYYERNPEILLLNYEHKKEISNVCFLDFLKMETQKEYELKLDKHMNLLIKYHIPIYYNIQIKHFKNENLFLTNSMQLRLLERFQWKFVKSKQILFSYLFFANATVISIPDSIPFLKFNDNITNIFLKYYLPISTFAFSDIEMI